MFDGTAINPAYAGSRDVLSAAILYRNEMAGFDGAPKTQGISVHGPLKKKNIAVGFSVLNNKIGVSNNFGIFSNYAYHIKMGRSDRILSFGLGAGFFLVNHKWSQIVTRDENDMLFEYDTPILTVPDFSTGIYYYTKKLFIGTSIPFFMDYSYNEISRKYKIKSNFSDYNYFFTSGYLFENIRNITIKPSILVAYNKKRKMPVDINTNVFFKDVFWIGISYRIRSAIIAMVGINVTPQLSIGYCFDYSTSELSRCDNGSHEIIIRYDFGFKIDSRNPRF